MAGLKGGISSESRYLFHQKHKSYRTKDTGNEGPVPCFTAGKGLNGERERDLNVLSSVLKSDWCFIS